jgi:hypothetical protein
MSLADDAIALLRAGHTDVVVARQLHIRTGRVSDIRKAAGIAPVKSGPTPTAVEERFHRLAQPTADGHLLWPQTTPPIRLRNAGRKEAARTIAFRIDHGRNPIGRVTTGCDQPGCVHPQHVEDQPMRDTYRAIFGKETAA